MMRKNGSCYMAAIKGGRRQVSRRMNGEGKGKGNYVRYRCIQWTGAIAEEEEEEYGE